SSPSSFETFGNPIKFFLSAKERLTKAAGRVAHWSASDWSESQCHLSCLPNGRTSISVPQNHSLAGRCRYRHRMSLDVSDRRHYPRVRKQPCLGVPWSTGLDRHY